ncbi:hypothetical protein GAO09_02200 [Rhizobiales bacterium RZME27]|jgi:uncharacterized membrane protein|uniref:Uncharacterized protein n=1 Tax=Endobacterium cereale TaxID=2663029 RepID=A0A6A8A6I7_9HYPH|nr:hypothetical protein [Endobacterium cereale]MEB2844974.1 hypothetical protein [Endobacterium cereale]MQY44886.1 hypothetical protein [Endobacterium cereale]
MSLIFHFLSLLTLVAAIGAGTLDSIQSVASSSVSLASMGDLWIALSPGTLVAAEDMVERYIHADAWQQGAAFLLTQPACAVFLVMALVLWIAGYRRPKPFGRFSA